MKLSLVLILLVASFLSTEATINGQIWHTAPFIVHLQYLTLLQGGGQGAGAIISGRHILTSGFVLQANFVTLNVNLGGVTRITQRPVIVQERIQHPLYTLDPRTNDIGIILLQAALVFDRFVQPIALPSLGSSRPYENEQGIVLGFGGRQQLEGVFLRVTPFNRCFSRFPNHAIDQQFCGEDVRGRSDFCAGDMGAPFITQERGLDILVGVASIQFCQNNQTALLPSLVTRVSNYVDWINERINNVI